MQNLVLSHPPSTVKTGVAGEAEDPAAVIESLGSRLRATHSRAELHELRAAADRDFRARRANFHAVGGVDYAGRFADAPLAIRNAYAALHVALTTMAAINFALDPVYRVSRMLAIADKAGAPIGHAR